MPPPQQLPSALVAIALSTLLSNVCFIDCNSRNFHHKFIKIRGYMGKLFSTDHRNTLLMAALVQLF